MPVFDSYNNQSKTKRSLVLAGGGVRLAYHAGVLMALEEEGLAFNHIDGTSGGIFGTAMLASGISPKEAAARWRKLDLKGFMSVMPLKNYRSQRSLPAMGSAKGIRKKIFPALGIDIQKINKNTTFDSTFNVCNFSDKTVEAIPHNQVTEDHLIAGMSLPMFMPAVNINGDWYTDAVWIKDANLIEAINRGAQEIWLIWCIGNTREYLNGFFNQYVHMIEISANGGLFAEIDWLKKINVERAEKSLKPIVLHLIKPVYPLPLDPDFFFGKINADTLINMGYADAKKYLEHKQSFDLGTAASEATAMADAGTTLHFRQQFYGETVLEGKNRQVNIQLSFYVRHIHNRLILQLFSSISTSEPGAAISGYNNRLLADGKGGLISSFNFLVGSVPHTVSIKTQLNNIYDFLLGIDCKTARVSISETGKPGKEKVFHQPALNRIKNAIHVTTSAKTDWYGKIKSKKQILTTLFNFNNETQI